MITKLRIPTQDQFAFLEIEFEGAADEAYAEYRRVSAIVAGGEGLEPKEWNRVIDNYLWGTKDMKPEEYEQMNPNQQSFVQQVKLSRKRFNA
jgi:hypothetical protein